MFEVGGSASYPCRGRLIGRERNRPEFENLEFADSPFRESAGVLLRRVRFVFPILALDVEPERHPVDRFGLQQGADVLVVAGVDKRSLGVQAALFRLDRGGFPERLVTDRRVHAVVKQNFDFVAVGF